MRLPTFKLVIPLCVLAAVLLIAGASRGQPAVPSADGAEPRTSGTGEAGLT